MEAINPTYDTPEHTLWAAVISTAIQSATKTVRQPEWAKKWHVNEFPSRIKNRNEAVEFFHDGSCTNILMALGVDPGWFYRKLKFRHPEIFTNAMEGEHDRPDHKS